MQQKIKYRLAGVLAIIVIGMLCLPLIFYQRLPGMQETSIAENADSPSVMREVVYDLPIKPEPVEETKPMIAIEKPVAKSESEPEPQAPITPERDVPKKITMNGSLPEAWTLQVASFADPENAKHLVADLRQRELLAYTQSRAKVTQVFVGPYINKNQAERLQLRLEQEMHLSSILRKYQP